jgi:hypothetical protein
MKDEKEFILPRPCPDTQALAHGKRTPKEKANLAALPIYEWRLCEP